MQILTKSQKARNSVRTIKTTIDALALRGYYKPTGKSGQTLAEALRLLSPEIYGTMNDQRIIEIKGLEYVVERLPWGIEKCNRIILTAREEFENTSFELIIPPKRRRACYLISEKEICFVITRGFSEIYDMLTHITFMNNEAEKIFHQMKDRNGEITHEWKRLEEIILRRTPLSGEALDKALWNLSIILGRTMHETKESYDYLEKYARDQNKHVLLNIIYGLGKRVEEEKADKDNELMITFTPSLQDILGNQSYSRRWADDIKRKLSALGFHNRPVHIISANLHSVVNLIYGYGALCELSKDKTCMNVYDFISKMKSEHEKIKAYADAHGLYEVVDRSGTHIDCQIIDTAQLKGITFHPDLHINTEYSDDDAPVLFVMDYAFGTQAFEAMDELLDPYKDKESTHRFDFRSISVMGKAGILIGKKGDIMLANSHVFEGTSDNYMFENDISRDDFPSDTPVYTGPMVTVVGTSLQNRDLLKRFQASSWKAIGLEMEGGHYQKAITASIIRGHISRNVKIRYAYYASDNPLLSGQTLASGSMGAEGIKPTYMITKVIVEKIMA
ncbi:MAG: hypothetical protein KKD44_18070 [Proteobacteria bacterium]|nr:hypothetical protein [Pseudomonadota bacterium]